MGRLFKERIPLSEALRLISELKLNRVGEENVSIFECCGRILAEDIVAKWDVPHFDRAAMDGYAVRAEDTFGASPTNPISLKLVGDVEIGEKAGKIGRGEAIRISTGAMMPKGANAVVMLEFAGERDGYVDVFRPVTPWENVSRRGEDIKAGEIVLRKGEIVQPQDVGVMASLGYKAVRVLRRPKVGILATGNELLDVGEFPEDGKIINSNAPMLFCAIGDMGCDPIYLGRVGDEFQEIECALKEGIKSCDAIVITGGTSAGRRDLVPDVIESMGKVVFHGIAIKPGMPTGLGVIDNKPILMLPGFPVACLIALQTIFPEVLARLTGVKVLAKRGSIVKAKLERRVPSQPGVRAFVRIMLKDDYAEPIRSSGSGILTSMVKANGMLVIPEDKEGYEEGDVVEVMLIRDLVEREGSLSPARRA